MRIVALATWGVPDLYNALLHFEAAAIPVHAVVCAKSRQDFSELSVQRGGVHFKPKTVHDLGGAPVPFYFVESHNESRCHRLLAELQADVLINLGTPNILKEKTLAIPSVGVVNCHPGLLPQYRGCTCVEWSIYNGDPVGATCHFMTEGIDDGPIIAFAVMPVEAGTEYAKIRADMVDHQVRTLISGLRRIAEEGLTKDKLPQQGEGSYYGVIPDELMPEVIEKTRTGDYSCAPPR